MDELLVRSVEDLIASRTGHARSRLIEAKPVSGGSINSAFRIHFENGKSYFLKFNSVSLKPMFECEVNGLRELNSANAVRIPEAIGVGETADLSYLVLEFIESAKRQPRFSREMGIQLAFMHQTSSEKFGFHEPNYLGNSHQPNSWMDSWVEFWRINRLGFQLRLASENGKGNKELQRLGDRLLPRLDEHLAPTIDESPALLHGDLWSGNYISGPVGEPVFVDPAAYFGHREAEFGMTTLFGGFDADFYDAYNEVNPLAEGSTDRIAIYRLYHLLNHLNLFGRSYLDDCLQILKKYA